jgi:hypothetical protein
MKTSMKSAALLAITLASASMRAAEMVGNVPVDFRVGKATAPAGVYFIVPQRAGIVSVKTAEHKLLGFQMLGMQTADSNHNQGNGLRFQLDRDGHYQLTGYCLARQGCWERKMEAPARNAQPIEVAMATKK